MLATYIMIASAILIFFSVVCNAIRLFKGPTIFDRILCFDGISVSLIAMMIIGMMTTATTMKTGGQKMTTTIMTKRTIGGWKKNVMKTMDTWNAMT